MTNTDSIAFIVKRSLLLPVSFCVLALAALCGCVNPTGGSDTDAPVRPIVNGRMPSDSELTDAFDAATAVMKDIALSDIPSMRANALEAMATTLGGETGDYYLRSLSDPVVGVRFTAVMSIAETRYEPGKAYILRMLVNPRENSSVRAALVYAMYRFGQPEYLKLLGGLIDDPSAEVRANVALVMGMTGLPQAIKPLKGRLPFEDDAGVNIQLAESLAMLGDAKGFSMLNNYARVGEPYQQVQAIMSLGRAGSRDQAMSMLAWALSSSFVPPQRIAAAGAMGRYGDSSGFNVVAAFFDDPDTFCEKICGRKVVIKPVELMQLKCAAALAFGEIGQAQALDYLLPLLKERPLPLKLTAAKAIALLELRRKAKDAASRAISGSAGNTSRPGRFSAAGNGLVPAPMKE